MLLFSTLLGIASRATFLDLTTHSVIRLDFQVLAKHHQMLKTEIISLTVKVSPTAIHTSSSLCERFFSLYF